MAYLAPEIWAAICAYAGGEVIQRLFCCGSPVLAAKLMAHASIPAFDIYQPHRTLSTTSIAATSLLKYLIELRIWLHPISGSMAFLNTKHLCLLPSSIKIIKFRFKEAESCWKRAFSLQQDDSLDYDPYEPAFGFQSQFPTLTMLHLHANLNGARLPSYDKGLIYKMLSDSDIEQLPSSLTSLSLPVNHRVTPNGVSKLPPTLDYLELGTLPENSSFLLQTFSRFTCLRHLLVTDTLLVNECPKFSSILESLCVPNLRIWDDDILQVLPKNLTILDLGTSPILSNQTPSMLPQLLLSLDIGLWNSETINLGDLPRSLTSLHVMANRSSARSRFSGLPPGLRSLEWEMGIDQEIGKEVEDLPHTLTNLHVPMLSIAGIENLPPSLSSLTLGRFSDFQPSSLSFIKIRNLRKISFSDSQALFKLSQPSNRDEWISLNGVVEKKGVTELERLEELGCNWSEVDRTFMTPIEVAVIHNQLPALHWLYFRGADPRACKPHSATCLASQKGHIAILRYLIDVCHLQAKCSYSPSCDDIIDALLEQTQSK